MADVTPNPPRPGKATLRFSGRLDGRLNPEDGEEYATPAREVDAPNGVPTVRVIEMQATPGAGAVPRSVPRSKSDFHRTFYRGEDGALPCASLSQRTRGIVLLNLVRMACRRVAPRSPPWRSLPPLRPPAPV